MSRSFFKMILLSMSGRRKSIYQMGILSFLCIFFLADILIYQDCMGRFRQEEAAKKCGNWLFSSEKEIACLRDHAWIDEWGRITVRGYGYGKSSRDNKGGGAIAAAEEGFWELSNLRLSAGTLPVHADEIAITEKELEKLGYKRELGQTIEIYFRGGKLAGQDEDTVQCVEFQLTGILKNDMSEWFFLHDTPEYFVSMAGLDRFRSTTKDYNRCFYRLADAHRNVNTNKLYKTLRELVKEQQGVQTAYNMQYNSNVYGESMWGGAAMHYLMSVACILLGCISLIYMITSYCEERRRACFCFREFGATPTQLRCIFGIEWCILFFSATAVALVFAVALSAGISWGVARFFGTGSVFQISNSSACVIAGAIFGQCLLVLLYGQVVLKTDSIYEGTGAVSVKRLKYLSKRKDHDKNILSVFMKRQKRKNPAKNLLLGGYSIILMAFFLYGCYMLLDTWKTYQESEAHSDIIAISSYQDREYSIYTTDTEGISDYPLYDLIRDIQEISIDFNGISGNVKKSIERIPGVESVEGISEINQCVFLWEGQSGSHFRQGWYVNQFLLDSLKSLEQNVKVGECTLNEYNQSYDLISEDFQIYPYKMFGLPLEKKESSFDRIMKNTFEEAFQEEQFWSGKQSVLFALSGSAGGISNTSPRGRVGYNQSRDQYYFQCQWDASYLYDMKENSISSGSDILIQNRDGKEEKTQILLSQNPALCAELLGTFQQGDVDNEYYNWRQMIRDGQVSGYILLSAESLAEQVLESGDKPLEYREIKIDLQEGAKEGIENKVTEILAENNLFIQNNIKNKKNVPRECFSQWTIYGILVIILGIAYLLIGQGVFRRNLVQRQEQLALFYQCGIDRKSLWRGFVGERVRETWICLGAVPIGFGMVLFRLFQNDVVSSDAGGTIPEWKQWEIIVDTCLKEYLFQPWIWIAFLGFLLLSLVLFLWRSWSHIKICNSFENMVK